MRLQRYINEKFFKSTKFFTGMSLKSPKKDIFVEVFVNPSSKEMNDASKNSYVKNTLRFTADIKNKKLYVFTSDVLHQYVWRKMIARKTGDGRTYNDKTLINGIADKKGGKWRMARSDGAVIEYNKLDWLKKWLDIDEWLKNGNLRGFI